LPVSDTASRLPTFAVVFREKQSMCITCLLYPLLAIFAAFFGLFGINLGV